MTKQIGVLTAGGVSPGLNAAIRGIGKTAISKTKEKGNYSGLSRTC